MGDGRGQDALGAVAVWRALWAADRRAALQVCDEIVSTRPVPLRLVQRLGRTKKLEYYVGRVPPTPW